MTNIYVTNKSTLVSDADVQTMTRAVAHQVRYHAAPLWGKRDVPVIYLSNPADAAPGSVVIAVMDDSDQQGVLGWHTEDQGEVIYGRVFARPVLDNGGNALTNALSVASVLSHEVLETFADRNVNLWADSGTGKAYAVEIGDPVESDSYTIGVAQTDGTVTYVTVSNFVTPHWFDPQAKSTDRFDYMRRCSAPFQMTSGGYVVVMSEGTVSQKFGDGYPEWRKATKQNDLARSFKRSTQSES